MAAPACDPKGACSRCGYENGPGATRCLRCHQILTVPRGCSGQCTRCLIGAIAGAPAPVQPSAGRTNRGR